MNSQRKLSYDSSTYSKNLYRVEGNDKNTVNFIIKKKSPLQQLNERIMQATSDIRHQKILRYKNHSDHKFIHQFSPTNSHKSSDKYEPLKYPSLKFNYGSQQTDFKSKSQYFPTNYQVRNKISSKVNFFYENPVKITSKNLKTTQNQQINPVYQKSYESTDFILFSNNLSKEKNSGSKNKINFNYIDKEDKSSKFFNSKEKKLINYPSHESKKQHKTQMSELQKKLVSKSLKRTKSHQDFMNIQAYRNKTQQTKSNYQNKRKKQEQIFYDMDEKKNLTKSKNIQKKQKSELKKQQLMNKSKIKVVTTRISEQKNPSIMSQFINQSINKQSKIIAAILIILAIGIFLIQLCS